MMIREAKKTSKSYGLKITDVLVSSTYAEKRIVGFVVHKSENVDTQEIS